MNMGDILKTLMGKLGMNRGHATPPRKPRRRSEQDVYFTSNFFTKANEWGLTEDHARHVFYEGDTVKGKENMKVARYKGEEIGIYVFRDRDTNQPVITSIWKRIPRGSHKSTRR
jgi:hypothetical protein